MIVTPAATVSKPPASPPPDGKAADDDARLIADVRALQAEDEAENARLILARAAIRDAAALDPVEFELKRAQLAMDAHLRIKAFDDAVAKFRAAAEKKTNSEKPKAAPADEKLQGSAVLFHEPEPWSEPVDGAATLSGMSAVLESYLHLPPGAADTIALWIGAAHCFEAFPHSPRLNVTAATRGCGKTLLLDVTKTLTPRALRFENLTLAVLFRITAKEKPTTLFDECDRHLKENFELIGLLNAGFTRGGVVPRCEGDKNEVRLFPVFGPVALSGIGELPGTLHDRSIVIHMERARPDEIHKRFDSRHVENETELKRRLMRWAADNKTRLEAADPAMPQAFNRVADVWRPLFAVALVAGGDWLKRAAVAFAKIQRPDADSEPVAVQALQDVAATMDAAGAAVMASADLVSRLVPLDERPWATWNHGRPISTVQVARMLRGFGIRPTLQRGGSNVFRGYRRASLNDALSRYAHTPPVLPVTELQPTGGAASEELEGVTRKNTVTGGLPPKPLCDAACNGVTIQTPPTRATDEPSLDELLAVDNELAGKPDEGAL